MNMTHEAAVLALNRISGIGFKTVQAAMAQGLMPVDWFRLDDQTLLHHGATPALLQQFKQFDWRWVEQDLVCPGARLTYWDADYPPLLRNIAQPPLVLFVQGDVSLLSFPQLAVVGTRKPTLVGLRNAYEFGREIARTGMVVTSGLALGIDAEAHRGALEAGKTIAVLGTGVDQIYPKRHRDLAQKISESGVLLSEFPTGTAPLAENFPRRNRIISGLSAGVLVIEADLKSGSLLTAKAALEQGREVFAMPGSTKSLVSRGCHELIKNGAGLVESLEDMACILPQLPQLYATKAKQVRSPKPDELGQSLLKYLKREPLSVEELARLVERPLESVAGGLVRLELMGWVKKTLPGTYEVIHD